MKFCFSGGAFNYEQYHINDIAEQLEEYIYGHECDDEDVEYAESQLKYPGNLCDFEKERFEYIAKHRHTKPNDMEYDKDTIHKMKMGLRYLKKAYVYAQRIDWLLSGDDGEETFKKRLDEALKDLEKGDAI